MSRIPSFVAFKTAGKCPNCGSKHFVACDIWCNSHNIKPKYSAKCKTCAQGGVLADTVAEAVSKYRANLV